jgi:hypothetical protein
MIIPTLRNRVPKQAFIVEINTVLEQDRHQHGMAPES